MAAIKYRSSRNLLTAIILLAAPAAAVLIAKGTQKPWIPNCPVYRQKGDPNAKITLVEFSDFQCPSCAYSEEPLKHLISLYSPNVRLLFKHRPWPFHKHAAIAALAAECAGKQGKFWELHDILYEKQPEWGESEDAQKLIDSYAASVRLDMKAYAACVKDPTTQALVDADSGEAKDRWVNATPTFFVNGLRVVGAGQLRKEGVLKIEKVLGR